MSRFVAGHAQRRRPSSESQQQQSSQEMSLKEGTQIMHGLIQELSALKYVQNNNNIHPKKNYYLHVMLYLK